jgi:hypothetical protein
LPIRVSFSCLLVLTVVQSSPRNCDRMARENLLKSPEPYRHFKGRHFVCDEAWSGDQHLPRRGPSRRFGRAHPLSNRARPPVGLLSGENNPRRCYRALETKNKAAYTHAYSVHLFQQIFASLMTGKYISTHSKTRRTTSGIRPSGSIHFCGDSKAHRGYPLDNGNSFIYADGEYRHSSS